VTNNSPPDAEETAAIKQQEYENVKAEEQEINTQAVTGRDEQYNTTNKEATEKFRSDENENDYTEERIHKEHEPQEYVTLRDIKTIQAPETEVPEDTSTIDLSNLRPKLPKRVQFALTQTNNLQCRGYAL